MPHQSVYGKLFATMTSGKTILEEKLENYKWGNWRAQNGTLKAYWFSAHVNLKTRFLGIKLVGRTMKLTFDFWPLTLAPNFRSLVSKLPFGLHVSASDVIEDVAKIDWNCDQNSDMILFAHTSSISGVRFVNRTVAYAWFQAIYKNQQKLNFSWPATRCFCYGNGWKWK